MRITRMLINAKAVAVVEDEMPMITDPMVAMEIAMRTRFELGVERLAVEASALTPEFFDPEGKAADGILEQFAQYGVKCAVFGPVALYGEETVQALEKKVFLAEEKDAAMLRLAEN